MKLKNQNIIKIIKVTSITSISILSLEYVLRMLNIQKRPSYYIIEYRQQIADQLYNFGQLFSKLIDVHLLITKLRDLIKNWSKIIEYTPLYDLYKLCGTIFGTTLLWGKNLKNGIFDYIFEKANEASKVNGGLSKELFTFIYFLAPFVFLSVLFINVYQNKDKIRKIVNYLLKKTD